MNLKCPLIVAGAFILSSCSAQKKSIKEKVSPAFLALITESDSKKSVSQKKGQSATVKYPEQILRGDSINGRYDCIVYTKNAQAIRKQGIIVNSVLPTFVTASATIKQIKKMATMPEVTYIEAPGHDTLHINDALH